jgi:hypothetical protein
VDFAYGFILGFSVAGCLMWWIDKIVRAAEVL